MVKGVSRLDLLADAPLDRLLGDTVLDGLLAPHPLMPGTGRLRWTTAKGGRRLIPDGAFGDDIALTMGS